MSIFKFSKKSDEEKHSSSSKTESTNLDDGQASENLSLIEEKKDMIKGIEDLSETSVKEVMIPRIDVDFISIDTPKEELLQKIAESGHSRFPVYSESIDNVLGILYVKDLLAVISRHEEIDLQKLLRVPYFVPESKRIDGLLGEFKRKHLHIAVAVDEYGGISGIVCMEDIIEEIVGDIQDEFDNEVAEVCSVGDMSWMCDARVNLEDLNENINSNFPTEDFDTLGGFVLDLFGKIPAKEEKIKWNNFEFIVQDMQGHRVNLIKVTKLPDEEDFQEE